VSEKVRCNLMSTNSYQALRVVVDVRLLCCRVLDTCPANHCSHSIFLSKDKVLRPPIEPAVGSGPLAFPYIKIRNILQIPGTRPAILNLHPRRPRPLGGELSAIWLFRERVFCGGVSPARTSGQYAKLLATYIVSVSGNNSPQTHPNRWQDGRYL
jgi:hypothetical protein